MENAAPAPAHLEAKDPADFFATNKSLRACFACRLVKSQRQVRRTHPLFLGRQTASHCTSTQFEDQGCENCQGLIKEDAVELFTTRRFSGCVPPFSHTSHCKLPMHHLCRLITVMAPQTSWASKWLHLEHCVPGCYAMSLDEEPDEDIEVRTCIPCPRHARHNMNVLMLGAGVYRAGRHQAANGAKLSAAPLPSRWVSGMGSGHVTKRDDVPQSKRL
jgi:hypothetical protein